MTALVSFAFGVLVGIGYAAWRALASPPVLYWPDGKAIRWPDGTLVRLEDASPERVDR